MLFLVVCYLQGPASAVEFISSRNLTRLKILCKQSRSQSPRYPCPAERENEDLWDEAFPITGFLLFRSNCAGVSV